MPQHDYVIANASGATVRGDINNALAAIRTNNSGATEPTAKFTYMLWYDSTADALKIRNAANTAWLTLVTFDQTNGLFRIDLDKGADIASATTTDIGAATGNYVVITGTVTITGLGTIKAGTHRWVRFAGALTLTHNATSLILPGGADITTAAGDMMLAISEGSGNWRVPFYQRADGKAVIRSGVVQVVSTQDGAVATGTTTIPNDDTIPQITEGDEYMTLAITPKSTSNILLIDVVWHGAGSVTGNMVVALFRDSVANALAAGLQELATSNGVEDLFFRHEMTAPSTSAITFRVRAGQNNAGTTTFNGGATARKLGGIIASSITITEIAPNDG